jgi:hypothetical protein
MAWFASFWFGIADVDFMSAVELSLLAAVGSRHETSCLTKAHLE